MTSKQRIKKIMNKLKPHDTTVTITEPPTKALKKLFCEEPTEITAAANFETKLEPLDNLDVFDFDLMPIQFNIDDNPNETIIEPQTLEVLDQVKVIEEDVKNEEYQIFTKDGNPRKRKKYNICLKVRKQLKQDKLVSKHKVLPPCNTDCRKKCIEKLPEERRVEINVMF
ncbi:hypothetical protein QTP88_002012 [Uroleucon formosanum]